MVSNSLLAISLLTLATATPLASTENEVSPRLIVYDDLEDTTSFADAVVLTNSNTENTQVFGQGDSFDYIKYTATYTRQIQLAMAVDNNKRATINVYLESKGLTTPVKSYLSTDSCSVDNYVFVEQGDTIYFKIRATGNCLMESELLTNFNTTSISYHDYPKYHGYTMPHTGPATIYYSYDSSCYQNVPGETFTFANALDEAISIWEGVGEVDFVYNSTRSTFDVVVNSAQSAIFEVITSNNPLTQNWHVDEFNMVGYISHYNQITYNYTNQDGTAATIYQAVLADAVCGFGFVLGISTSNSTMNVVSDIDLPYEQLGPGDIEAYTILWGDANYS